MYRVVLVSPDPALQSLVRQISQLQSELWQYDFYPTVGSFLAAPHHESRIQLLFYDSLQLNASVPDKRMACYLAPLALRVVITEVSFEDVVIGQLEYFHTFMARAADAEHIEAIFDHAKHLQQLDLPLSERRLIGMLRHYPVYPSLLKKLDQLLQQPDVTSAAVVRLIEHDMVLTARLLQLVNSPYMGFLSPTLSLETAVSRLGFNVVYNVALLLSVRPVGVALDEKRYQSILDQMFMFAQHCRQMAVACRFKRLQQDQVFIGGLLSGFGKLVLLANGYADADPALQDEPHTGVSYVQVSAYLLTLWGFPLSLMRAVLQQQQLQPLLPEASDAIDDAVLVSNTLYVAGVVQRHQVATLSAPDISMLLASPWAAALGVRPHACD